MPNRIVKNYPSPRLMETIGATNQKPSEAIGELVANSFDARINDNKMNISVDMRDNMIVVLDDGKGMTIDVLEKAVCIAEDMSIHLERGEGAKGHFGMGFKTSCSTLGRFYEIYTKPINSEVEYHVSFDIADYSKRPSGADAWDIEIEEEKSFNHSPLKNMDSGTAFVIKNLKDKNITVSSVLDYLGEAFKGHLISDDCIRVIHNNGTIFKAIPKKYGFVPGTKINIDIKCGPNNIYKITGWVALDTTTHNDGLYGFNIYRNNQLVEKWEKSWFAAHLMTSRIIGEVNMDFLEATFYKQGTQQSESWACASRAMKEFLVPIVSASRNISRKGNINNPTELRKIVSDLKSNFTDEEIENNDDSENEVYNQQEITKDRESINKNIREIVKEQSLLLEDFGEIEITYLEKNIGGNIVAPFDYIYSDTLDSDEENAELQVLVYKDHPLWNKKIDSEVQMVLATSDAIYRMLVEKLMFDTSFALKIRNEWIKQRTAVKEE